MQLSCVGNPNIFCFPGFYLNKQNQIPKPWCGACVTKEAPLFWEHKAEHALSFIFCLEAC